MDRLPEGPQREVAYPMMITEDGYGVFCRNIVRASLAQGVDGYGVWDGKAHIDDTMDVGLKQPGPVRPPAPEPREVLIRTIDGFNMDRYNSIECF